MTTLAPRIPNSILRSAAWHLSRWFGERGSRAVSSTRSSCLKVPKEGSNQAHSPSWPALMKTSLIRPFSALATMQQQERLRGKWVYEIGDLSGIRKAKVENVKAFASRTHDRARLAYGRQQVELPRRCVIFGTTNVSTYLKSRTGNRRFWPVKTPTIDIEGCAATSSSPKPPPSRLRLLADAANRTMGRRQGRAGRKSRTRSLDRSP